MSDAGPPPGEMVWSHGVLRISECRSIVKALELRGPCQNIEHLYGAWITLGMERRQAKALPEANDMVMGLTACRADACASSSSLREPPA